ncbi:MAG: serine--tRNA ligase, partial [Bacteroidales bacterium]|nr:serine--tRNA ligase [Bacteroidales bacterium]
MITLQKIREQKNEVIAQLAIKNFDATAIVERIIEIDELRKSIQSNLNNKQAEMNSLSKEIGVLFKNNQIQEANAAKDKTTLLKNEIKTLESQFEIAENDLQVEIVKLPNTPHSSVPKGTHADHNEIVSEH